MLFFTDENLNNGKAFIKYENYCKSNWYKMPLGLKHILKGMLSPSFDSTLQYDLHDGIFSNLQYTNLNKELILSVTIFDENDTEFKLTMIYKNSSINTQEYEQFINNDEDPSKDIMGHEVVLENDIFIHTILFASGNELVIKFSQFDMRSEKVS
jgi:hypothetical protein